MLNRTNGIIGDDGDDIDNGIDNDNDDDNDNDIDVCIRVQ
jgi:hypothetical protein